MATLLLLLLCINILFKLKKTCIVQVKKKRAFLEFLELYKVYTYA